MYFTREEFVRRAVETGKVSEDYADTLYLSFTDRGATDLTPEQIVYDDQHFLEKAMTYNA